MDIVTIVCPHVSWQSLLHIIVFVQAISVRAQTVCCPKNFALYFNVSLQREYGQASWFFPRSNTLRTVILGGASRPLMATILSMMTGPVSGRTASPATRRGTTWGQSRLRLEQRLTSSRAATGITDVPLRTMLWALRRHPRLANLQCRWFN